MRILKRILLFIPVMGMVLIVNFFGDVNMQFYRYSKIREMCKASRDGYNIQSELVDTINKRQLVKTNIAYQIPKTIVLGSSRTMQLSGDILEEQQFYNDSVGYAVLEDYVGIMEVYAEHEFPEKIIIGIDPWVFNGNNTDSGVVQAEFWEYEVDLWKQRLGYDEKVPLLNSYKRYGDLLSLAYFQDSWGQLFVDTQIYKIREDNEAKTETILTSEGVQLSKEDNWIVATRDSVNISANEMMQGKFNNFQEISEEKRELFENSITYLQDQGVEIAFLLIPFHPYMVEYFRDHLPVYFEVEKYLIAYAKEQEIDCYGSYESSDCGLLGDYFYPDGVHIRDMDAFKKLMNYRRN